MVWARLRINWVGRRKVIKINVLPCVPFIFLVINLYVPKNTIQASINRFIWNVKPARIKFKFFQQNILEGRLAVPNILKYYQAGQIVVVAQGWMREDSIKDSWLLEQAMTSIPLHEWVLLSRQAHLKYIKGRSIV